MGKLTNSLIIINVIIFEIVFSLPEGLFNFVFETFSFSYGTSFQIWRWFTNMFLHINASHLFFNMLGLYFFGRAIENKLPAKWFLSIYFFSGLLGNFVYMFSNTEPAVGASAAVFGLMGTAMFLNPLEKTYMYVFQLPLGIVAILFAIFETIMFTSNMAGPVANIAHIAGLFTGIIFAFFYSPKTSLKGALILLICILLILLLLPFLLIITTIGGFIIEIIDYIVGIVLYNIADFISVLWA